MIPYLLAAIALTGLACVAAAIWSGQLPWLKVITGAEALGPVGKPAPVLPPLPLDDDPEAYARQIAARDAAMIRADANAGHLDQHVPAARKETP